MKTKIILNIFFLIIFKVCNSQVQDWEVHIGVNGRFDQANDVIEYYDKGYYVEEGVKPLLTTDEQSSTQVIGWAKKYGKARIVTLQSGHDVPTFENTNFRKLLKQSIEWVYKVSK